MTASAISEPARALLRRLLDPASTAPIAVALSGGGDSLALLVLACEHGRETGRPVTALTVDHGLHPDSGRWTEAAGVAARRLGADWRPLVWHGAKPVTGLPAAARRARHGLLAEATRGIGAKVLLMGQTADDLAESALMRRTDIPTLPDPQVWAPSPVWPEGRGVFLCRPLLGEGRGDLRRRLAALGLDWLEDPANTDLRYARARARSALCEAAPPPPLPPPPDLSALAAEVAFAPDGHASLARSLARSAPGDVMAPLLGAAVTCVGGGAGPPRRSVLDRLAGRLAGPASVRAQVGGVRVEADDARILLARDAREQRRRPTPATPGVFDGRFETTADASLALLAGRAARLRREDRARLKAVPALARPALPVLDPDGAQPRLPWPLGDGRPAAISLVAARFAAACGRIACEADIG